MNTKLCRSCGEVKQASDFHIRAASVDGLSAKCKQCQRTYDHARLNKPSRVAARKAYAKTEQGLERGRVAKRAWAARNPLKRHAHVVVGNALRDGKLNRKPCEVCGNVKSEAHHDDYSKPLLVVWLCDTHHKARHRMLREMA